MIAVDTNILVRLLTQDDEPQYQASVQLFRQQEIFIPTTVILETEWVLRYAYDFQPNEICQGLTSLFGLSNVQLANSQAISQALHWYANGLEFADALHLATSQQCDAFYTFDNRFIKRGTSLTDRAIQRP